jgi:hypothetical protein
MLPRLLFLLKRREGYWSTGPDDPHGSDLSSGLRNSVGFIIQMLNRNGIPAKMMQLADNNAIDKAVHDWKPSMVILEAYWCVPEKLDVLRKLHPHVHWAVRNHSELAFLSNEGMSMAWTYGYLTRGVEIMNNSPRALDDMKTIAHAYGSDLEHLCTYAPNWYPLQDREPNHRSKFWAGDDAVKVICAGAIRPLKNHLTQAVAAIKFARYLGRKLEFNVNTSRVEGYGEPIKKNLQELFSYTRRATLVEHPWMPRSGSWDEEGETHVCFLDLMKTMNFSLQCSFSETFNIVSADAVLMGVPIVTSAQVPWLRHMFHADPNDSESIFQHMITADAQRPYETNTWLQTQWHDLKTYCDQTERHWVERFG